jgi:hypothetical protein
VVERIPSNTCSMSKQLLDQDQQRILYTYSLYTSYKDISYLQYTAALVLFYYLMKKDLFPAYKEHLLIYDYKDTRRFLWEDKKFMNDVNVVRNNGFLNRARLRSQNYRDMNAHQCTQEGLEYLSNEGFAQTETAKKINHLLNCNCGNLRKVLLKDDAPSLICEHCEKKEIEIKNFLFDASQAIRHDFNPAFL